MKTSEYRNFVKNSMETLLHLQSASRINVCKKIYLDSRGDIWTFPNGVKIYVPYYPWDYIQERIVESDNFFECDILDFCARYIPENATILDIGANIGNHSLYWATMCGAARVHAFEPLRTSYEYLCRNIEINNLQDIIIPHNIALGYKKDTAKIKKNHANNTGMTSLVETDANNKFNITVERLDDLNIGSDRIDFVKIDVEGFELKTLTGMRNLLEKYHPAVLIETFAGNYKTIVEFFTGLGYKEEASFEDSNYLFIPV